MGLGFLGRIGSVSMKHERLDAEQLTAIILTITVLIVCFWPLLLGAYLDKGDSNAERN